MRRGLRYYMFQCHWCRCDIIWCVMLLCLDVMRLGVIPLDVICVVQTLNPDTFGCDMRGPSWYRPSPNLYSLCLHTLLYIFTCAHSSVCNTPPLTPIHTYMHTYLHTYPLSLSYPNKRTGELGARLIIALMLYAFMSRLPTASTPLGSVSIYLHAICLYVSLSTYMLCLYVHIRCMAWHRRCLLGSPPSGMSLSIYLFIDLIIYWSIYLFMNVDLLSMPCYDEVGSWCIVWSNQEMQCVHQPAVQCVHQPAVQCV